MAALRSVRRTETAPANQHRSRKRGLFVDLLGKRQHGVLGVDVGGAEQIRAGQGPHLLLDRAVEIGDHRNQASVAILSLGEMLTRFQVAHPRISIELVILDRSVNPIEEGFDLAIGALPTSYPGMIDEPLCAYPRVICASPAYLERSGTPHHPRDLVQHDCLTFATTGQSWAFEGRRGSINVDVKAKLSANDSQLLLRAAVAGMGIARIARHVVMPSLERGELVTLLPDYPVPEFWVKALIPKNRIERPAVRQLLGILKQGFADVLIGPDQATA
jgi:DNA-binding transcriptional LysR family regulator